MTKTRSRHAQPAKLVVAYRVRVVHGGTGEAIRGLHAELVEDKWRRWVWGQRNGEIVVGHYARHTTKERPSKIKLRVGPTDPTVRAQLVEEGVCVRELQESTNPKSSVTGDLIELPPKPVALEIELADRTTGKASSGMIVEAEGDGDKRTLAERADTPGLYRTDDDKEIGLAFRKLTVFVKSEKAPPPGEAPSTVTLLKTSRVLTFSKEVVRLRFVLP